MTWPGIETTLTTYTPFQLRSAGLSHLVLQDIAALDKRINDDLTEGKVPVMVIAYAGK